MKCKIALSTLLITTILGVPLSALDLSSSKLELQIQSIKNGGTGYIDSYVSGKVSEDEFDIGFGDDESIYEFDYKSPKKAFIFSMLIPGWGQKYAGSHTWKPIVFLALEAGLWMNYFKYRNDGNKQTDAYQTFADLHWIEGDSMVAHSYRGWRAVIDSDSDWVEKFTHELPEYKDQQYYEMIGKYDQFRAGWDDFWLDSALYERTFLGDSAAPAISPNRLKYNEMRGEANTLLGRANKMVILTVVNHLLSAFDAALAARRYNREKSEDLWLTVRAEMMQYSATEEIPILKASIRF